MVRRTTNEETNHKVGHINFTRMAEKMPRTGHREGRVPDAYPPLRAASQSEGHTGATARITVVCSVPKGRDFKHQLYINLTLFVILKLCKKHLTHEKTFLCNKDESTFTSFGCLYLLLFTSGNFKVFHMLYFKWNHLHF